MRTSFLLDHEPVEGGRVVRMLLRIETDAPVPSDRMPLNLCLVLDRSGSMTGGKLVAARDAAARLVRRLAPEDVVSVVAYDDEVRIVAEPATGAAQTMLPREIGRIETGGSTNLSGGWMRGRELVARNRLERGINRVILLTDGLANVGITDFHALTGMAAEGRKHNVSTTTIGFGTDYDEKLLRAMADAGGGNAYYIESTDQAAAIFNDELQGLLDLGAQNVTVVVAPAPAARLTTVHHDYASTPIATGTRIELGDLYAREPKPLLVQFLVFDGDATRETAVAEVIVTADVLLEGGAVEHRSIRLPVTIRAGEPARVEPEVRRELLLLEAAEAQRQALRLRERGDMDAAADVLSSARARLREAGLDDAALAQEEAELASMHDAFVAYTVSAADAKYMYHRAYNSATGRRMKDELIRRKRRGPEPTP